MFTKRKEIVIGDTYLFDVLNETNLAPLTSLVTVIKKVKRNKYIVLSVNNGDIFEIDSKFLTPFVNPETASVVRCHYGTTEFTQSDLEFFDYVDSNINMIAELINSIEKTTKEANEAFNIIRLGKLVNQKMREKVKKYVDISNYKETIAVMSNIKNRLNEIPIKNESMVKAELPKEFTNNFDSIVAKYNSGEITLEEFITKGKTIILNYYPTNLLLNNDDDEMSEEILGNLISNILNKTMGTNSISFIIGIDNNDEMDITILDSDDITNVGFDDMFTVLEDSLSRLFSLTSHSNYIPKYRFNVLTVCKKGEYNG